MKYQADFTVWSDLLCETSIKAVNPCIFSGEEWRSIFVSLLKYAVAHGGTISFSGHSTIWHSYPWWTFSYITTLRGEKSFYKESKFCRVAVSQ